jgi:uncharacterized membrane protein
VCPANRASVGTRWGTGRTEAFSDGVFAIAITLLVLDINIPPSALDDLPRAILHEWPAYLGYVTSFSTIGGIWLAHHAVIRRLATMNNTLMRLNLLLLMAVAFLPFPTRLMAEAIHQESAERTAVIFYGLTLLTISSIFSLFWRAALRDRSLLAPEVKDAEIAKITRATTPNIGFYGIMIVVGILSPKAAAFGYLGVAFLGVARARGDRTGDSPVTVA